jgi:teichuronic acid biosynthesis glycosyltransferase TuaC
MANLPRVLMITSEWPTPEKPYQVPFIVRQVRFLRQAGVELDVFNFSRVEKTR